MKKMKLLPRKLKYIGAALSLVSLPILFLLRKYGIISNSDESLKNVFKSIILLGLLLIILSKEKIEDEFVDACRLIAFRIAFMFGIGLYISGVFIFSEAKESFELLFGEIGFYLIIFYSLKSGLIKYDK